MQNNNLELVFILDKSGSMQPLTEDTIGGFNSNIAKHREDDCNVLVTTVLFDSQYRIIHDRIPIREVPVLTAKEYEAYGSTALYDAVGSTVRHIEDVHRYIRKEDVPEAVLFIIITDGMENASRTFFGDQVRSMVEAKKELGWDFVFIGAGIDAFAGARDIGISERAARSRARSKAGMGRIMEEASRVMDYSVLKARNMAPFATVDEYMEKNIKIEDEE